MSYILITVLSCAGCVHRDGRDIIIRVINTLRAMLRARSPATPRRASNESVKHTGNKYKAVTRPTLPRTGHTTGYSIKYLGGHKRTHTNAGPYVGRTGPTHAERCLAYLSTVCARLLRSKRDTAAHNRRHAAHGRLAPTADGRATPVGSGCVPRTKQAVVRAANDVERAALRRPPITQMLAVVGADAEIDR
jgi:hypothetical protein